MPSIKSIKQRKSNVQTTRQIIRAMDMVAAAKLNKAKKRLDGIRPLYSEMQQQVARLSHYEETASHVFAAPRAVKNTAYMVITSNKGLCGSYNANICLKALEHMEQGRNEKIIVMGNKGYDFFRQHNKNILYQITDIPESQTYETSGRLGELAASRYLAGEVDEIYLAYTYFQSTLNHEPCLQRLLPLPVHTDRAAKADRVMRFQPDIYAFIDHLLPLYLHTFFFAALSEAAACEHAARMVNMDAAGKNANDVIDDLNRMYNRKRQTNITRELTEIIGGANILD